VRGPFHGSNSRRGPGSISAWSLPQGQPATAQHYDRDRRHRPRPAISPQANRRRGPGADVRRTCGVCALSWGRPHPRRARRQGSRAGVEVDRHLACSEIDLSLCFRSTPKLETACHEYECDADGIGPCPRLSSDGCNRSRAGDSRHTAHALIGRRCVQLSGSHLPKRRHHDIRLPAQSSCLLLQCGDASKMDVPGRQVVQSDWRVLCKGLRRLKPTCHLCAREGAPLAQANRQKPGALASGLFRSVDAWAHQGRNL
jgi:hypothetical protein